MNKTTILLLVISKTLIVILMTQYASKSLLCVCFVWHTRCKGLMILETFTTEDSNTIDTPPFITMDMEITDQPLYSMYNLSRKDYHPTEVKAGVTRSSIDFDYRQVYAKEASSLDDVIVKNGFC